MTPSKLLIIGAGGHGKVVADTALAMKQWTQIAFLDDAPNPPAQILDFAVLGSSSLLGKTLMPSEYQIAIAIGNNLARANIFNQIQQIGFESPIIIHPSAVVSRFAQIGAGSVIFAQAVIQAASQIGRGVIINTAATIDHDCIIGDFAHISPAAHLAGGTQVGEQSWLGINSCTKQFIKIGKNVIVGAGGVVVKNISDGITVVGNPASELLTYPYK